MRTLALPLRVTRDGQLDRGDATDQIVRLIQAMVATTAGTWPHAPWFGLHEQFLEANMRLQEQPTLVDALNAALANLGAGWAQVRHVRSAATPGTGDRRFDITLLVQDDDGGERVVHGTIAG